MMGQVKWSIKGRNYGRDNGKYSSNLKRREEGIWSRSYREPPDKDAENLIAF